MKIGTARKSVVQYAAELWIDGGGSPIAVDPDPTTVTLASLIVAGRILQQPRRPIVRGFDFVIAHVCDGTTLTGRFWWYDDTEAFWFPIGAAAAAVPGGANQILGSTITDSKQYFQVTANTGVTKVAVTYR